jgi:hypothetical protein
MSLVQDNAVVALAHERSITAVADGAEYVGPRPTRLTWK